MSCFIKSTRGKIVVGLACALVVFLCVCFLSRDKSIMDFVKIDNIEKESYKTGEGGFFISGDITNTSNRTFFSVLVRVRYWRTNDITPFSKEEYILEDKIYKLNPGETETFRVRVDYEELGVSSGLTWFYDWEIYDVVLDD